MSKKEILANYDIIIYYYHKFYLLIFSFEMSNLIIIIEFLAFLILDQRPSLCSCPTAAIRWVPSFENFRSFT